MSTKSIQRSLVWLREHEYTTTIVEKFNPFAGPHGKREDLFGVFDLLSLKIGDGIVGVQCCGADWSSHVKKITQERRDIVTLWLSAGGKGLLIGWRKKKMIKKDGTKGKADRWYPRVADILLNDDGEPTIKERDE